MNPYDEDGYCKWCGNGRWKHHAPDCEYAALREPCGNLHPQGRIRCQKPAEHQGAHEADGPNVVFVWNTHSA